ncbi:MAG: hypothetical protein B6240_05770 [Desulfobacteraceae bacterium 4572_87]|nr:MAG: hypothetical protein B6240_05770 [Desulfobacteraceae bacterium 4572_87]
MMFRFAYPVMFLLAPLALAWLAFALFKKPTGITYSMTSRMAALPGSGSSRLVLRIPTILRACCLLLLILVSARPQLYNVSRDVRSPGVDIMLCLDTSGSMQALDFDRTAIGSAIAIGGKRLKDLKAKSKILILLTDGRNNAGEISPQAAAQAVREFGIKLYTIGVGGKGPAALPLVPGPGHSDFPVGTPP